MPDQTIENKNFHEQAEILKKEYAELFELKNHMLMYEEVLLRSIYLTSIGNDQYRLFSSECELAIIKQKIQLAQVFFNKNELPNWKEIDSNIEKQFAEWQIKIEKDTANIANAKAYLKSGLLSNADAEQLKNDYKWLIERLHPDLNPNQTNTEKEIFISVQAAYDMYDLHTLDALISHVKELYPESRDKYANIKVYVQQVTEMNKLLQSKINKLNKSFPFNYREKLQDNAWIKSQQEKIERQITYIRKEIHEKAQYLLLLQSWKPQLSTNAQ